MIKHTFLTVCALGTLLAANAQNTPAHTYNIQADKIITPIPSTMYGIFFEDINLAADGGVYAELVKNRSFEFNMPLAAWTERKKEGGDGRIEVINRSAERPENPRYIKTYVN